MASFSAGQSGRCVSPRALASESDGCASHDSVRVPSELWSSPMRARLTSRSGSDQASDSLQSAGAGGGGGGSGSDRR